MKLNHDRQMRKSIAIIITSILVLSGCNKQQSVSDRLLNEVEKAIAINPDSASNLLKSISSPEKLDDKAFARWCMLSGKITDEIFNSILPTYQLERAYDWYSSHGSPDEQVQILIYLGRSYFADGDYDKAMSIYTNALDIAEKNKLNNLTGYTYSYIGDLYGEKFMRTEAIKRYKAAAECFKKENNTDSYACALRDVGREYAEMDSLSHALHILIVADSVANKTKNIEVTASINNALGKGEEEYYRALASSFMLSADNAHAVHPNHPAKTDVNNCVYMNEGIVVKSHAGQKYTSDAVSIAVFKGLCKKAGVPVQFFSNRSDTAGGSTLGNIAMAQVSMNSVDIGLPQLAMHSSYETAGVKDTAYMIKVMEEFFNSHIEEMSGHILKVTK